MARFQGTRMVLAVIATLNLSIPWAYSQQSNSPDQGSRRSSVVRDVALLPGGRAEGQLVDSNGRPVPNRRILARQNGQFLQPTETNAQGFFVIAGLRGGVFHLASERAYAACRGWVPSTAPPAAVDRLLLVEGDVISRGQRPISELFLNDAVIVGAIVAAAIAIPVAIHNSRKSNPSGS